MIGYVSTKKLEHYTLVKQTNANSLSINGEL